MKNILLIALLFCSCTFLLQAQETLFAGQGPDSPEILPDGSVIVRLYAPNADSVKVTGDFLPPAVVNSPFGPVEVQGSQKLTRSDNGVWSFHSQPLPPELYSYKFNVDGVDCLDPSNIYRSRDIASYMNIFIITRSPGDKGSLYSVNEVPHGNVSKVWYESPTLKTHRRMTVYTPAGYEKGGEYPVLYLLHGAGGDEEAWSTLGRAAQILDNLIASGSAKPMIVVMTNGNTNSQAAPGEWSRGMYRPSFQGDTLYKSLATMDESFPDVIDYVDTYYRTRKGKENRAICGLSMGGGHTYAITKRYPELFDYVGLFSAAIFLGDRNSTFTDVSQVDPRLQDQLAALFAANPKLYWIAIGKTDFLYQGNADYRKFLDMKGYPYEYVETEGGHIWRNWRLYLSSFAQKLFQ